MTQMGIDEREGSGFGNLCGGQGVKIGFVFGLFIFEKHGLSG
jgi:hypothetical protein